jgi:glycosyltransferase involved in cell wall biosynthesis
MYMGRFVEFKGVEYLIRAFGIVERQRQNAALLIVGYGPLKDHLEAVSQSLGIKRIHFAGDITDVHVRAYLLKRSNMVVVPSIVSKTPPRQEGGPLVVLEALSAGKPVICTNATGSAAAFIKDGINGYMVPQKNVDALADKIKRLLDTPIVPTRVLSTFREIKGYDHQVEQMQRAVNYCLKRES